MLFTEMQNIRHRHPPRREGSRSLAFQFEVPRSQHRTGVEKGKNRLNNNASALSAITSSPDRKLSRTFIMNRGRGGPRMPRGAPRGGGPFVPRGGGNFVKRAAPRGIPSPRSRGGFVPRRPAGIAPARGRGRAMGGPDAPRGPGGLSRGRGGRARGRGRGGNSFFDSYENNYPDRIYVEEVLDDESRGGYGQESKVELRFSKMFALLCQFQSHLSERTSVILAALSPASAKNWTNALFLLTQGYGKYRALEVSKKRQQSLIKSAGPKKGDNDVNCSLRKA